MSKSKKAISEDLVREAKELQRPKMTGSLSERAMLAGITIRMWTNRREDKAVSLQVAQDYGVDQQVGRYNKFLLVESNGKPAREYVDVTNAANALRREHMLQTLPWSDDSTRILPASNYMGWNLGIARAEEVLEEKFEHLFSVYYALIRQSEAYFTKSQK